jgi:CRISPR/Cas system-associated endoribonuclease Cas2
VENNKSKKGEAVRTVLNALLLVGAVAIAATSPMFGAALAREFKKEMRRKRRLEERSKKFHKSDEKYPEEKIKSAFYYLKRKGLLEVEYRGPQMYITLTEKGVKRAGKYKINDLEIKKPEVWDKKWRVLIFDISDKHKIKREALRGKLKQLRLFQLQKSVWVCPYEFQDVVKILREFFGLTDDEMKIIVASEIENDQKMRSFFTLN